MIRSYYRCCCIHVNKPVHFSHCDHLKLGHWFHALLKVCSDRDDIVPLTITQAWYFKEAIASVALILALVPFKKIIIVTWWKIWHLDILIFWWKCPLLSRNGLAPTRNKKQACIKSSQKAWRECISVKKKGKTYWITKHDTAILGWIMINCIPCLYFIVGFSCVKGCYKLTALALLWPGGKIVTHSQCTEEYIHVHVCENAKGDQ